MAKGSGTKGSRSERKAGRQRALRAREHGLPERHEVPLHVAGARAELMDAEGGADTESSPGGGGSGRRRPGPPVAVWVVGGALLLLALLYVLSRVRDLKP